MLKQKFNKDRIRALRELNGLSVAEFGKKIDVSRQLVSAWERGTYTPSVQMLERIANAFNAPIDSFFTKELYHSDKRSLTV